MQERTWMAAVFGLNSATSLSREPKSFSICCANCPLGGSYFCTAHTRRSNRRPGVMKPTTACMPCVLT